jgi:CRISPR system Cascade subunit CasA
MSPTVASMFNLLTEPWIPVRWAESVPSDDEPPDRVGLRAALVDAHRIQQLAPSQPHVHAALLRVLYALTARVTGLDERGAAGDWLERQEEAIEAGQFSGADIDAYFGRYDGRFFLYDEDGGRPWMQDPRLARQCDPANTAGVNKLVMTRPSGNNHAWFRHGGDGAPDLPTSADAALHLLTWHYYGPSGRCSSREVDGVKSASTTAGPLRTALSYHPEGENLFQTLLAGLVPPTSTVRREEDLCPWEWEKLPDPEKAPDAPTGPCARLTACSQHAVLLVPGGDNGEVAADAYITWAYRQGRIPRDDPYLIWQVSQQGNRYPRPADSSRALWRDVDTLLEHRVSDSDGPQPPLVFETARGLWPHMRVRALGFEQEGQAKNVQFVEGVTPFILGEAELVEPSTRPKVARLRQLGERYGRRLDRAVRRAYRTYTDDKKADAGAWSADAAARYWPAAEREFWARFRPLQPRDGGTPGGSGEDFDVDAVRSAFLRLAEQAYDIVTERAGRTLRGAKAVSDARIELYGGPRRR